jgi:hypothetical protein
MTKGEPMKRNDSELRKAVRLKKRRAAHKCTRAEKQWLASWERVNGPAPDAVPTVPSTSNEKQTPVEDKQTPSPAGEDKPKDPPKPDPPTGGAEEGPPPITVGDPRGPAPQGKPADPKQQATGQTPPKVDPGKAPNDQARAMADVAAASATAILIEMNQAIAAKGFTSLAPEIVKQAFQPSFARLLAKAAPEMDQDTADAITVCGMGAFTGVQLFRIKRAERQEKGSGGPKEDPAARAAPKEPTNGATVEERTRPTDLVKRYLGDDAS